MIRPKILTVYLDTWYGTGRGVSSERMQFGDGLFDQLGWDEIHIPLEAWSEVHHLPQADAVFHVPYQRVLPLKTGTAPLIVWMSDCVWRQEFGLEWAAVADLVVTTDRAAYERYGDKGVLSNWACRPEWDTLPSSAQSLTASFHGQLYGKRRDRLVALEQALEDPECPVPLLASDTAEGYKSPVDYFRDMQRSAFSLCLTESSHGIRQMKSRMFEPQLFDSVLVTEPVDRLEQYWDPGRECIVFETPEEAAEQIRALCRSHHERKAMAERAHKRLLAEHTYQKRLTAVFDRLGVTV